MSEVTAGPSSVLVTETGRRSRESSIGVPATEDESILTEVVVVDNNLELYSKYNRTVFTFRVYYYYIGIGTRNNNLKCV